MGCFQSKKEIANVIFLGLDNAGKSSIVHFLQHAVPNEITKPTIAYNQAKIIRGKYELIIWDVGGDNKGRDLWRHYIKDANAIVFVVDATDEVRLDNMKSKNQEEIDHAKFELHNIIKNVELSFTAPLLVFSNKHDKQEALKTNEIQERLDLDSIKSRQVHIVNSCALSGEGIEDGIAWLCEALANQKK